MKKLICISLIGFLLTASCKKDKIICTKYTELTDRNHLVDISALSGAPELLDTLAKYPQLQVFRIINDQYTIGMHCNVFYSGVKSFTDDYRLFKSRNDKSIAGWDTIPVNLTLSLTPSIQFEQAISIAKQKLNYDNTCISYRLGIYDTNSGVSYQPKNYTLTWKIQGDNEYPYVILDANSGQVYIADDGIRQ